MPPWGPDLVNKLILFSNLYKCKDKSFRVFFILKTSVDTEMCCPKGKCGCQYFRGPGFF